MRFVILHYHFFKNAGSTIEDILDHSFGDRFGKLETAIGGGVVANPELVRYLDSNPELLALSSHQIRHPLPQAPGYLFFDICFLRDPLDRLRSFYDYFLQRPNPADPMSELANNSSLGEFSAGMIREHSLFIRNNQVNLLACGGDSDEPEERDLDLAIRRMMATSFLGVVDGFAQSSVAGAAALRPAFPELDLARPPVNVSRGMQGTVASRVAELRDACDPEVYNELLRITALDRRLVELARVEVARRSAGVNRGQNQSSLGAGERRIVPADPIPPHPGSLRRFVNLAPYWRQLLKGEYRDPKLHQLFDPAFYLRKNPDVAAAGVNLFRHYLKHGYREMRAPHPLFDPSFYLEKNPDVRRAGLDPLLHYLRNGAVEDRKPHPLFDPKYYRANCGTTLQPGENPLVNFLESGALAASPHPLFNCEAYRSANPEVTAQGMNPLVHYLNSAPESAIPQIGQPASVVELEIRDIQMTVIYLAGGTQDKNWSPSSAAAMAWEDAQGQTHWIAEPQQLPFFHSLSLSQLRAQA